jgi:hypothetical protein
MTIAYLRIDVWCRGRLPSSEQGGCYHNPINGGGGQSALENAQSTVYGWVNEGIRVK